MLPFFVSFILLLLAWRFMTFDYKHMWQQVKESDLRYMSAAGIIFFLINFLLIWRWRILMKAVDLKAKRLSSMRWFFLGLFFSSSVPFSTVGNDVIRGLGLSKEVGHKTKIFASIVLDRLSGFVGLVIVAVAAYLFGHGIIKLGGVVVIAIATLSIISGAIAVLLFSHRIFSFACRAFTVWPKVKEKLMRFHYDIVLLKRKQKKGWEAIMISVFAQIVLAIEFYLAAKGMHQNIPLIYFTIFSPIVCVVTSLPSIAGLGSSQIAWVSLLPLAGVSLETAWGLSFINCAFIFVNGLLGGLFYVTTLSSGRIQYPQADGAFKRSSA